MMKPKILFILLQMMFFVNLNGQIWGLVPAEKVDIYMCYFDVSYRLEISSKRVKSSATLKMEILSPEDSKYSTSTHNFRVEIEKAKKNGRDKNTRYDGGCRMLIIFHLKGGIKEKYYIYKDGRFLHNGVFFNIERKAIYDFMSVFNLNEFRPSLSTEEKKGS